MMEQRKKAKIAVLVSGAGTNLQALIDAQGSGILQSGEIRAVITTNPRAYALERASKAGIETLILPRVGFEEALEAALEERGIDLIILAGFMRILSGDFTARWPRRILNVHPALIPSFCGQGFYGLKVHEAALERGVKVTGATVHFVNEIPDGGEIILQKAVTVEAGDTPETLQRRVMEQAEWIILPASAESVCAEIMARKE